MVALSGKHSHGMVKDTTATLYTLIQPACAMLLLVDGDRKGLSTTVIDSVDESHIELVWVLGEMMSASHSCPLASAASSEDGVCSTCLQRQHQQLKSSCADHELRLVPPLLVVSGDYCSLAVQSFWSQQMQIRISTEVTEDEETIHIVDVHLCRNQRVNDRIDWEAGDDVTGLIPIQFELGVVAHMRMKERSSL